MTATDLRRLRGAELRALAAIWKRGRRELRARFGGSSMAPAIPPESEVLLLCEERVEVDDVIAFVQDDRLIVHRVVGLSADPAWVLTCGDARRCPDVPIQDRATIVGRVLKVRRGEALVSPPPPPRAAARAAIVWVCLRVLRGWPAGGHRLLRLAALLRRVGPYGRAVGWRRLGRRLRGTRAR